uniref:hypothetical protein n=1 Tax=Haloferax profundi TaxID=1544718 RepID=UPI001E421E1B
MVWQRQRTLTLLFRARSSCAFDAQLVTRRDGDELREFVAITNEMWCGLPSFRLEVTIEQSVERVACVFPFRGFTTAIISKAFTLHLVELPTNRVENRFQVIELGIDHRFICVGRRNGDCPEIDSECSTWVLVTEFFEPLGCSVAQVLLFLSQ